jgi:hypothetical protein
MIKFAKHNNKNKNKKTTIMKKSIALVAMAFGVTSAFAQDLTSKKGEPFLPEAGDYAIAIDATPFFSYAKSFIGAGTGASAPTFDFATNNMSIWGKYFKDANTAYRVGVRLGFGNTKNTNKVDMLYTNASAPTTVTFPTEHAQVDNTWKQGKTNIGITVGIEKRKGKTRLQGFYGAEAGISFSSTKDKYTYGNALTAATGTVTGIYTNGADAFTGQGNVGSPSIDGMTGGTQARMTEMKSGANIGFGVRGFVGAEYFMFPKISIGGEFGWGLGLNIKGKSKTTWESNGQSTGATDESTGSVTINGSKSSSFGIDTDNMGGVFGFMPAAKIRLALHF